eukprot:9185061-Pyramimonas_sp.AAC.1
MVGIGRGAEHSVLLSFIFLWLVLVGVRNIPYFRASSRPSCASAPACVRGGGYNIITSRVSAWAKFFHLTLQRMRVWQTYAVWRAPIGPPEITQCLHQWQPHSSASRRCGVHVFLAAKFRNLRGEHATRFSIGWSLTTPSRDRPGH